MYFARLGARAVFVKPISRTFFSRFASTSSKSDPYQVLGVQRNASTSDIKKAYISLAKKYHPDSNKEPGASDRFVEIQSAYEILADQTKRAAFDQTGSTDFNAANYSSKRQGFEDIFDFVNRSRGGSQRADPFETIFEFMGGSTSAGTGSTPIPDLDIEITASLTFMDAALGTPSKSIKFSRTEICNECSGKGGTKFTTCITCKGLGQQRVRRGPMMYVSTCSTCSGSGKINADPCKCCQGVGNVESMTSINLNIPSGAEDGTAYTVAGEGHRAIFDGKQLKGNLLVRFKVSPSDVFERKGDDIYTTITVPLYEAIEGGTARVPTIKGEIELQLKPGTQPNDSKRIPSRGILNERTGHQGDHYVKFNILIPKGLSQWESQRATYQKVQNNNTTDSKKERKAQN